MTTYTTTYYTYDKSQRLTTQWSPSDAHYFTFNQRNMVTQIQDVGGGDANAYFLYNGLGERVVTSDTGGGTYFTFDGGRLLTEKFTPTGINKGRYRYNESGLPDACVEMEISSQDLTNYFNGL